MADGSFSTAPRKIQSSNAPWTTLEIASLREHYPTDIDAAVAALPGRTRAAIRAVALKEGIKHKRDYSSRKVPPRRPPDPFRDATLRELFETPPNRQQVLVCAARLGISEGMLRRRATQLGLALPRCSRAPWTENEDELLDSLAHMTPQHIAKRMKLAGHRRSPDAISARMRLRQITRGEARSQRGLLSTTEIGKGFGITTEAVHRWCATGQLASERRDTNTPGAIVGFDVRAKDLLAFMARRPERFQLRKINQAWFCERVLAVLG